MSYPVSQTLSSTFYPLPTIKTVRKNSSKQIIYDAAHHLFSSYPLHTPLLIYKYQFNRMSYDFYIERKENEWNDTVYTHPVTSTDNKITYIINGLATAIHEERRYPPMLLHMTQQVNIMCRLLDI